MLLEEYAPSLISTECKLLKKVLLRKICPKNVSDFNKIPFSYGKKIEVYMQI